MSALDVMEEPADDSMVMFEYAVDRIVWFRSDACSVDNGYADGERWFKAGDYDADPLTWGSVLASEPAHHPILLVRAS